MACGCQWQLTPYPFGASKREGQDVTRQGRAQVAQLALMGMNTHGTGLG